MGSSRDLYVVWQNDSPKVDSEHVCVCGTAEDPWLYVTGLMLLNLKTYLFCGCYGFIGEREIV